MISFFIALALLVGGYFLYGTLVEKVFRPDPERVTPAVAHPDGVDFVPMPTWKMYMIQFLDIAGLGPIFGTILGAMYGTSCYIWIVVGCIFGGAVHDYMSGMLSLRNNGRNVPEIAGKYLGPIMRHFCRILCIILMVMCGTVFVTGSAGLLARLTPDSLNTVFWGAVIFTYFILATLIPIDKLIGRVYPFFGACLIFMALGIMGGLIYHACFAAPGSMPEFWDGLFNMQRLVDATPADNIVDKPILPMMFISIACGAVSGFHATQAPLVARCMTNERQGRVVFYGSMVTEGIVGLIWAAAATYVFHNGGLMEQIGLTYADVESGGGPVVVNGLSRAWLGAFGAVLAIVGVVACPITSGDTAMRAARLMVAEIFGFDQKKLWKRLAVALPLFGVSLLLLTVAKESFGVLWRYFAFFNQFLASCTLWIITIYLFRYRRGFWYWIALVPAVFMSTIIFIYLFRAPECLGAFFKGNVFYMNRLAYWLGGACSLVVTLLFMRMAGRRRIKSRSWHGVIDGED